MSDSLIRELTASVHSLAESVEHARGVSAATLVVLVELLDALPVETKRAVASRLSQPAFTLSDGRVSLTHGPATEAFKDQIEYLAKVLAPPTKE